VIRIPYVRIGTSAKTFCRNASTVTEGFLCNQSTARFQRLPLAEKRARRVRLRRREAGPRSEQPLGCNERGAQEDRLRAVWADAVSPDDKRWPWLVYDTGLVPLIGQPLVVFASSLEPARRPAAWDIRLAYM
jgi:hypothetical protein